MLERIQNIAQFLNRKKNSTAKVGIILGSGLGELANKVDIELEIPYHEIPDFPVSTIEGHKGSLIYGKLNGIDIVMLNGRFHYYEGYNMKEVTLPIQVLKEIGIEKIILSNAAGGMNPTFKVGDIMIIKDHLNLFGTNPLIGSNDASIGPRFLDMSESYSKKMIKIAFEIAHKQQIHLQKGVYAEIGRAHV